MDRIKYLILRLLREEISPEEKNELGYWASLSVDNQALLDELQDPVTVAGALAQLDQLHRTKAWERVANYANAYNILKTKEYSVSRRGGRSLSRRWAVAAAVLLLLGTCTWWVLFQRPIPVSGLTKVQPIADRKPGTTKAILTLSTGKQLVLDSAMQDTVLREGNSIVAGRKGQLAYNSSTGSVTTITYNTLATPKGGQYQLTLPDGTRVWLNAASSIMYPTTFVEKERRVTLSGEAYFEVTQNKSKPFIVNVQRGSSIEVLGTSFNINAYNDEPVISTTLLAGSVKVNREGQAVLLKAGQQAQVSRDAAGGGQLSLAADPDLDQVMAWRNGSFLFNNTNLDVVMRQLARWYDVDVVYQKGIPPVKFAGEMKRDLNLSEVLNILRKMEVHCNLEGKKLIVMP